ncbi:MAG: hypothetical protein IH624_19325 [Phycisphaerae bacterium]|nr:hypothetical protein [Phycisphaerae bacterium]
MAEPNYLVYDDEVIAVGLFADDAEADKRDLLHLAIRWLRPPLVTGSEGQVLGTTSNCMGGETEWFLMPHSLGAAVGRTLLEQKASGLDGFDERGFKRMVAWLVEMEEVNDAMCY